MYLSDCIDTHLVLRETTTQSGSVVSLWLGAELLCGVSPNSPLPQSILRFRLDMGPGWAVGVSPVSHPECELSLR